MKIVCDNCSTKYSIADEKVRGKVFKIKCKKCSHIIVVKGAEGAEGAPPQGFDQKETRVFDYSGFEGDSQAGGAAAASPGAAEPVWHLVIDREQVGPLSVAEVAQKLQAGEIDADTYGWREGFGDWLRLGAIDELAAVVSGGGAAPAAGGGLFGGGGAHAAPAAKADPTDLFGGAPTDDEPASDLFGGGGAAHSPALAAAGDGGVFASAPMAARRGGEDLFGGGGGGAEMDHSGGGGGRVEVKSMTGQRNENSVLFSLNNLASLATETPKSSGGGGMGGGANPAFTSGGGTDGSGLIDIRAMAAMTLGTKSGAGPSHSAGSVDDLPVFSPSAFSAPSAGILLPTMNTQSAQNKKIYILMGVLGVLALTAIILVVVVLTSKPAEVVVQAPPAAADPAAPDQANTAPVPTPGSMGTPAAPPSTPSQAATPTPSAPVAAVTPSRDDKPKSSRDTKSSRDDKRSDKPSSKPERAEKPEPEEKPEPVKSSGTKCDEVACLVDSSLPCCKGSRSSTSSRPAASASSGSQEKLERADIVTGIGTVRGRVMACNDQYKVPGTVSVKIVIENSGSVGSATVTGKFAGTPTGDCVEKAVSKARFKKFGGPSVPVTYPFAFR